MPIAQVPDIQIDANGIPRLVLPEEEGVIENTRTVNRIRDGIRSENTTRVRLDDERGFIPRAGHCNPTQPRYSARGPTVGGTVQMATLAPEPATNTYGEEGYRSARRTVPTTTGLAYPARRQAGKNILYSLKGLCEQYDKELTGKEIEGFETAVTKLLQTAIELEILARNDNKTAEHYFYVTNSGIFAHRDRVNYLCRKLKSPPQQAE